MPHKCKRIRLWEKYAPATSRICFQCLRNATAMGSRTTPDRSRTAAKSGLSASVRRITSPITMSTALTRNGMRHPHDKNCSSDSCEMT